MVLLFDENTPFFMDTKVAFLGGMNLVVPLDNIENTHTHTHTSAKT